MTEQHSTGERDEQVTVLVPEQPPELTPGAARALLRLLLNTARQNPTADSKELR